MSITLSNVSGMVRKGRRTYQEDRIVALTEVMADGASSYLLAVMDGHGGSEVSEFCCHYMNNNCVVTSPGDCEQMLADLFLNLHEETKMYKCGTTLSLVCIFDNSDDVITATLGDSPIIIGAINGVSFLNEEHNVGTNSAERERVMSAGAMCDDTYMYSGTKGVQLTRALGDCDFDKYLSRKPVIKTVKKPVDGTIIVCSDGFLDAGHRNSEEMAEVLIRESCKTQSMAELAIFREHIFGGYVDNAAGVMFKT